MTSVVRTLLKCISRFNNKPLTLGQAVVFWMMIITASGAHSLIANINMGHNMMCSQLICHIELDIKSIS